MGALRIALVFAVSASVVIAQQPTPDAVRARLEARVRELRAELDQQHREFDRLLRVRIAWDLLLPVEPERFLSGTSPAARLTPQELESTLAGEALRTRRLRDRLARVEKLAREAPEAQPESERRVAPRPAPGGVANAPSAKRATVTQLPQPIERPAALMRLDHAPRVAKSHEGAPIRPRPSVADPFAKEGRVLVYLQPARSSLKRAWTYLEAGYPKQALAVIGTLIDRDSPDPGLLFLEARAFEKAGDLEGAKQAFQSLLEVDTVVVGDGEDTKKPTTKKLGPWAQAAATALAASGWRARTAGTKLRGGEGLRW